MSRGVRREVSWGREGNTGRPESTQICVFISGAFLMRHRPREEKKNRKGLSGVWRPTGVWGSGVFRQGPVTYPAAGPGALRQLPQVSWGETQSYISACWPFKSISRFRWVCYCGFLSFSWRGRSRIRVQEEAVVLSRIMERLEENTR